MGAYNSLAGATTKSLVPAISKAPVAPSKGLLDAGSPLSLTVVPKTALRVGYQWSLNNVEIAGANFNTYDVAAVGSADAGSYTVTLSNLYGSVTSKPVVIMVNNAPAVLPVGGTLAGTVNWSDSLAGASTENLDLDFLAKTISDVNDPASKISYSYKRSNSSNGVVTATSVWTGKGKETETTKKTYTLVFGNYDTSARSWPVALKVSGSYSGKDAAGKAYKGTISGSGSVAFVKP
jgi:hypothetical protein